MTSANTGGGSGGTTAGGGAQGGASGSAGGGAGMGVSPGGGGGMSTGGAAGGGMPPGTPPSTTNNCGVQKVNLKAGPADLLLVLDRSRSMVQDVNGGGGGIIGGGTMPAGPSKWSEVVGALDPVIMQTQTKVAWGLKLFPVPSACGVPDGATVPVALNNYTALLAAINAGDPGQGEAGSTPTRMAMEKATAVMMANTSPNAKYLVLATDGLPNCGSDQGGGGRRGGGGGGQAGDATAAIQAVTAAATAGFPTFVVGIATAGTDADTTLNQMAIAGGRPRTDPNTKYYPVASRNELVAALGTITGQIASCTFQLNPPPPVPDNVAVEVDGMRIPLDTTQMNGWSYGPGNHTVVLFGAACNGLKTGAAKNVQILYGCPGMIIK